MNFSTHKNQIADLVELALGKEKKDLIARFKIILGQCDRLFESDRFTFWLKQLGSIPVAEIPITKFGVGEASRSISYLRNCDRNHFQSSILHICEQLFTYSDDDDLCPFQTKYHYYFYIPTAKVFKESEMGDSDLDCDRVSPKDIRIAQISELKMDRDKYIL